jgi:uncharacterized membrane protein YhaH (DUF805 family)
MKCYNCEETVSDSSRYCRFCGVKQVTEKKAEDNEAKHNHVLADKQPYYVKLFAGRLNRRNYFIGYIVVLGIIIAAVIIDAIYAGFTQPETTEYDFSLVAAAFIVIFYLVYTVSLTVRRFHDLGKSGWWIITLIIPIVNGIVGLYLTFADGDEEANKYGKTPKPKIEFSEILCLSF